MLYTLWIGELDKEQKNKNITKDECSGYENSETMYGKTIKEINECTWKSVEVALIVEKMKENKQRSCYGRVMRNDDTDAVRVVMKNNIKYNRRRRIPKKR